VWVGGIPEELATEEAIEAAFAGCGAVRPPNNGVVHAAAAGTHTRAFS
jgi:hypothetical protein